MKSRFFWYDLMASNVPQAKSFYGEVVGWKTQPFPGGSYELLTAPDQVQIGGLMPTGPKERPQWLGYVNVEDVDAKVKQLKALGGTVHAEARDIPDIGRFAVVADPQGAVFALFKPKGNGDAPSVDGQGHIGWAELNTTDWKAAWKFYSELLGWKKTSSMDMGPELGEYHMFSNGEERSMGGMSNTAGMMNAPPHWLHYINVKSVDETVKQIPAKGGKVLNGPMEVPGGDRIAQCVDPQGALFAIFSSNPNPQPQVR